MISAHTTDYIYVHQLDVNSYLEQYLSGNSQYWKTNQESTIKAIVDLCKPNESDPLLGMKKVESKAQRIKCFYAFMYNMKEDKINLQY